MVQSKLNAHLLEVIKAVVKRLWQVTKFRPVHRVSIIVVWKHWWIVRRCRLL